MKSKMTNDSMSNANILIVFAGKTTTADIMVRLMTEYSKVRPVNVRTKEVLELTGADIEWSDTVIIVRGADYFLSQIIVKAKKAGKKCIFYIDDDLLSIYKDNIEFYEYLKKCLETADVLWTSNHNILEKYSKFVDEETKCINTIVMDPWRCLHRYQENEGKVKIVFAGSPSHEKIIRKYISPAISEVYQMYSDIEMLLVGYKGTSFDGQEPYIRTTGWFNNTEDYREFLIKEKAQIGIAVIEDSEFGRCKFYNKFLEYTKLGIMGLYSNCEPYTLIVKDGVNGILVNNTVEDWKKALITAINSQKMREQCVNNAQSLLNSKYSTQAVIDGIHSAMPELESFKSTRKDVNYNIGMLLFKYRIKRYCRCIRHPFMTVKAILNI